MDGYYARNTYKRNSLEDRVFLSDVKEDYTYLNLNSSYVMPLPKGHNLTFSLIEFLKISQDEYRGSSPSLQHLRSSESLFFVDYAKRWGRKVMLVSRPGVSYLAYKLRGEQEVTHLATTFLLNVFVESKSASGFTTILCLREYVPNTEHRECSRAADRSCLGASW